MAVRVLKGNVQADRKGTHQRIITSSRAARRFGIELVLVQFADREQVGPGNVDSQVADLGAAHPAFGKGIADRHRLEAQVRSVAASKTCFAA